MANGHTNQYEALAEAFIVFGSMLNDKLRAHDYHVCAEMLRRVTNGRGPTGNNEQRRRVFLRLLDGGNVDE